jgi:hypothetical protein
MTGHACPAAWVALMVAFPESLAARTYPRLESRVVDHELLADLAAVVALNEDVRAAAGGGVERQGGPDARGGARVGRNIVQGTGGILGRDEVVEGRGRRAMEGLVVLRHLRFLESADRARRQCRRGRE